MDLQSNLLIHSKVSPFSFGLRGGGKLSVRHTNKHLQCNSIYPIRHSHLTHKPLTTQTKFPFFPNQLSTSSKRGNTHFLSCVKINSSFSQNPQLSTLKNLSFDSLKNTLLQLTPYDIIKLSTILSVTIAATKWATNGLLNPFFWMYFSWTWMFWPWIMAGALAVYGLYCFRKYVCGEANIFEQLAIVTSTFTWLTLVPPAHFNGFLEGWPFVFFFVYHYFFFFNVSVRKRLYGDYYLRPHDPKWDVKPPRWRRLLFCIGVMLSHWLAAFEGPELHRISGGVIRNVGIWVMILVTLLMQYNSTLYLAKYSEKVVVPTAVVQFGPYRWVRHPIYASTMLLFAGYCIALQAPLASLSVVAVCLWYYEQRAKLEEALMVETFGDNYVEYASKVRYKFIPFVY
ncbi:hypothetical protein CsatB_013032 [Cannabis sativa]